MLFVPTCGGNDGGLGVAAVGGGATGVGVGVFAVRSSGLIETFWWCSHANVKTKEASTVATISPTICIRRRLPPEPESVTSPRSIGALWARAVPPPPLLRVWPPPPLLRVWSKAVN
jgi:hypothetical protein